MRRVEAWAVTVMDGLRACLEAELATSRAGAACFVSIVGGDQVAADHCGCGGAGCGMGWVRLQRAFISTKFPTPDLAPAPLDLKGPVVAQLEVGVMRCLPVGTAHKPPTDVEQTNATLDQLSDMDATREAITCCPELTARLTAVGAYTPVAGGGCGGGAWTVTVRLRPGTV